MDGLDNLKGGGNEIPKNLEPKAVLKNIKDIEGQIKKNNKDTKLTPKEREDANKLLQDQIEEYYTAYPDQKGPAIAAKTERDRKEQEKKDADEKAKTDAKVKADVIAKEKAGAAAKAKEEADALAKKGTITSPGTKKEEPEAISNTFVIKPAGFKNEEIKYGEEGDKFTSKNYPDGIKFKEIRVYKVGKKLVFEKADKTEIEFELVDTETDDDENFFLNVKDPVTGEAEKLEWELGLRPLDDKKAEPTPEKFAEGQSYFMQTGATRHEYHIIGTDGGKIKYKIIKSYVYTKDGLVEKTPPDGEFEYSEKTFQDFVDKNSGELMKPGTDLKKLILNKENEEQINHIANIIARGGDLYDDKLAFYKKNEAAIVAAVIKIRPDYEGAFTKKPLSSKGTITKTPGAKKLESKEPVVEGDIIYRKTRHGYKVIEIISIDDKGQCKYRVLDQQTTDEKGNKIIGSAIGKISPTTVPAKYINEELVSGEAKRTEKPDITKTVKKPEIKITGDFEIGQKFSRVIDGARQEIQITKIAGNMISYKILKDAYESAAEGRVETLTIGAFAHGLDIFDGKEIDTKGKPTKLDFDPKTGKLTVKKETDKTEKKDKTDPKEKDVKSAEHHLKKLEEILLALPETPENKISLENIRKELAKFGNEESKIKHKKEDDKERKELLKKKTELLAKKTQLEAKLADETAQFDAATKEVNTLTVREITESTELESAEKEKDEAFKAITSAASDTLKPEKAKELNDRFEKAKIRYAEITIKLAKTKKDKTEAEQKCATLSIKIIETKAEIKEIDIKLGEITSEEAKLSSGGTLTPEVKKILTPEEQREVEKCMMILALPCPNEMMYATQVMYKQRLAHLTGTPYVAPPNPFSTATTIPGAPGTAKTTFEGEKIMEQILSDTRNKYNTQYQAFMKERQKGIYGKLRNVKEFFFGGKVGKDAMPESLRKAEEEYQNAKVNYGKVTMSIKEKELKDKGLDQAAIDKALGEYKQVDLFQKLIIQERQSLNALNAAKLPENKRNVLSRVYKAYMNLGPAGRFATSTLLFGAIGIATGGIGYATLGSWAAIRAGRFAAGAIGGNLGAGGVKLLQKKFDTSTETKDKEIALIQKEYGEGKIDQITMEDRYAKALNEERKAKRNWFVARAVVGGLAAYGATTMGSHILEGLSHHTPPVAPPVTPAPTFDVKPVDYQLHPGDGGIKFFEHVKSDLIEKYNPQHLPLASVDQSHWPADVKAIIIGDPTELAKMHGMYAPGAVNESAMLHMGGHGGIDSSGKLYFTDANGRNLVNGNWTGTMFDANHSGSTTTGEQTIDQVKPGTPAVDTGNSGTGTGNGESIDQVKPGSPTGIPGATPEATPAGGESIDQVKPGGPTGGSTGILHGAEQLDRNIDSHLDKSDAFNQKLDANPFTSGKPDTNYAGFGIAGGAILAGGAVGTMGNKNKEELPNMKVGPDGKLIGEEIGTETPESLLSKMENPEENRKIQIQNKINEVLDETFGNKTIWKAILKGTGATSDLWDTYKNNSAVDTLEISDNRSGEVDPKFIPFMKALKKLRADSGILPESNTEPIEKYIERASEKVIDRIGTPEPSPVSTGV